MELRHLRYFIAVAEELHFGRAAKRLNITQQPLSQQIRQLELELDTSLFHRTKRTVRLTEAGHIFYEGATKILQQAEQTIQFTQQTGRGEIGHLEVGFTGPALSSVLPQIVSRFRDSYPNVQLMLNELRTPEQITELIQGRLHVGLLHPPLETDVLNTETIYQEDLVLVLPTNHPLANKAVISLQMLVDEPFILFPRRIGPVLYDRILAMFQKAGYSPKIVQEVIPQQTILSLVSVGIGLALMQRSLSNIGHSGVVFKPLHEPTPTLELVVAWHSGSTHPAVPNFLRVVQEANLRTPDRA
ncbi:LysR family transcriptional regulator [Leptolyngbya sp. NIES-2104]|uniref:LysR family transcriptional regulator n=1 Tax=Leptolyngbya sp. NIES-2104 TaxID=1552121 RepID=UPI0006EC85AD|nr:LysR family transcriptional regulator [Leptolyngbya sp. NIES-2104]GAP97983.1 aromatic hydrocarbon utilization transcriptional regulator CatR [Leptolyngbya sp. NIES-2104]